MSVAMIIGSLADEMTPAQIRKASPQLTEEDIRAVLMYAALTPSSSIGNTDGAPAVGRSF